MRKFTQSRLNRFVKEERGDGVTEYGTMLAYSALAFALVAAIMNAAETGLISTLQDDVAARMQWVAANQKGSWN